MNYHICIAILTRSALLWMHSKLSLIAVSIYGVIYFNVTYYYLYTKLMRSRNKLAKLTKLQPSTDFARNIKVTFIHDYLNETQSFCDPCTVCDLWYCPDDCPIPKAKREMQRFAINTMLFNIFLLIEHGWDGDIDPRLWMR